MHDHRPVNPPQPVWVRIPPAGRRKEALGVRGHLHAWAKEPWFGSTVWTAQCSIDGEDGMRWVPSGSVLPRGED